MCSEEEAGVRGAATQKRISISRSREKTTPYPLGCDVKNIILASKEYCAIPPNLFIELQNFEE